jgi:hypothetical protein
MVLARRCANSQSLGYRNIRISPRYVLTLSRSRHILSRFQYHLRELALRLLYLALPEIP